MAFNAGTKRENLEEFPAQVHHNHQHTELHISGKCKYIHTCAHVYSALCTMQSTRKVHWCSSSTELSVVCFDILDPNAFNRAAHWLAEELWWSVGRRLLRRWRQILMHGTGGKENHPAHTCTVLCLVVYWLDHARGELRCRRMRSSW